MIETKTAFLASALPGRFLLDHWFDLNLSRIVCASESLKKSFDFLKEKHPAVDIVSVPGTRSTAVDFLLSEVERSKSSLVIFHECCWLELDSAILKIQPVVEYYPCVTLNSWHKLKSSDLGFLKTVIRGLLEKDRNILKLAWSSLKYSRDFDFYEVDEDGGGAKKIYQPVLKEERVFNLRKSDLAFQERQSSKKLCQEADSKVVVFVVASDVVENDTQIQLFKQIALLCKKYGVEILIKDHPNPEFRLNLTEIGTHISSLAPFEVFEAPYMFKVGLFSTVLAFDPKNSVCIADLISPPPEKFRDRKKHLTSIPGGDQIKFVKSLEEFEKILLAAIKSH